MVLFLDGKVISPMLDYISVLVHAYDMLYM